MEMPEAIKTLLNNLLSDNVTANPNRWKALRELLQYQGPDVLMLLTEFQKRLKELYANDKANVPAELNIASEKDFLNTTTTLICSLFVLRGGNLAILMGKLDPTDRQYVILNFLSTKLNLLSTLGKTQKGSRNLTVARIAMCFPHFTCALVKHYSAMQPPIVIVTGLAVEYHTSVAPSLWTVEQWKENKEKHLQFMFGFAKIVNAKKVNQPSDTDLYKQLEKIQLASYNSKAFGVTWRAKQQESIAAVAIANE